MENNNTTFLNLKFDNTKLLASAKEAEKIANDTVKKISKSFNDALNKTVLGVNKDTVNNIDNLTKSVGKLSTSFNKKLNPALQDLQLNLKSMNGVLSKLDKTLSNIKANSKININVNGKIFSSGSNSRPGKQSYKPDWEYGKGDIPTYRVKDRARLGTNSWSSSGADDYIYNTTARSYQEYYLEDKYPNYFTMGSSNIRSAAFNNRSIRGLPNYYRPPLGLPYHNSSQSYAPDWEYGHGTDWQFHESNNFNFSGQEKSSKYPNAPHQLGWNGAYDAEWREQTPREKEARHAPDNSGHNINDQNITPEGDLSGFSLFNIKDFFGTEEKQRKKRTKAEDRFINGMTKVAGVLTGIYGVNSITNRVGNVIQEGAKLGLLSSYTGEDPKRLFLYNEAIKRTTHQDSYGQFETLRTRVMDSILQGDTNMANLLGISTEDAWKYNTPTKILDAVRTSKNLKTPELKQAFLRKMGIDDMTAMALTNEPQFGKDYKHVESIGAFSKENVDQMKDLVNAWEDLNQQSKVFMLNFIDPMTHFLHDMLEMSTRLNDLLAGHPNKHVSIQEQADAAYLNDSQKWSLWGGNHLFDNKKDAEKWKANWIKQHSPHLAASANGQNNVSASGIDINQIGYDMDGVESNHNPNAVNESATSSAIGAGQITPTTAAGYFGIHLKPKEHLTHEQREMVKQKLYDPKVNKNVQLWLIQKNLEQLQAEGGLQDSYLAGAKNRSLYWLGTTDLNKITPSQRKAVLDYGKKHPLHFKFDHHFHDAPADFDKKKHQGLMEDSFKSIFQKSLADAALAFASPTL